MFSLSMLNPMFLNMGVFSYNERKNSQKEECHVELCVHILIARTVLFSLTEFIASLNHCLHIKCLEYVANDLPGRTLPQETLTGKFYLFIS